MVANSELVLSSKLVVLKIDGAQIAVRQINCSQNLK